MLWSGGAATPHPVIQQGEAHPEQGDTRHALRRHVVPEPPPRTSERDRIWTGGDCGPNGVRQGRAGVGRPWSDTAGVPTGRQTDTRRQRRGRERRADSSGAPRSSQSARGRTGRKPPPPRFRRERSPPTPRRRTCKALCTPDLRGDGEQAGAPTPRPPHRTPRGTHILHLTHSSTNMFPWSSASLSLWEERPGAAVGSPDPEASGLAPSPPPPGSPP